MVPSEVQSGFKMVTRGSHKKDCDNVSKKIIKEK